MSNGKTLTEGRDVASFNDLPDGITSMQLLMPYILDKQIGNKIIHRNATLAIGRYDLYYSAKQAIANMMSFGGGQVGNSGQGQITHEIICGIDLKKNECIYLEMNVATGDVSVKKFDYDSWIRNYGINPNILKRGVSKR